MTYATAHRPFFEVSGFRFRLWPVLFAALLMEGLLWLGQQPARWLYKQGEFGDDQIWLYVQLAILFQGLLGLVGIAAMKRLLPRSEEHTSELESLMRTSYAVFCMKKKNNMK